MKTDKRIRIGMPMPAAVAISAALLFLLPPAGAAGEEAAIETVVPVHVGQVVKTTLHGYEIVYGRIQAAPAGTDAPAGRTAVQPSIDGFVVRLACSPGQSVKKGDVLLELDSRVAELDLKEQQQRLNFAQTEWERQTQLLAIEGTSQKECEQATRNYHSAEQALAAAQVNLDFHTLRAPISGTVTALTAGPGQAVQAGQVLGEVVNAKRRIVAMQLPVESIGRIRKNMRVEVETNQGWTDVGTLDYIAETVNPENGALEIRAAVPLDSALHIGQLIRSRIRCETHADCLAVPAEALVTSPAGDTYIAVIKGDHASRLPVVGKLREDGWIEVEGESLSEGMSIATEGAYGLPEETRVEVLGR